MMDNSKFNTNTELLLANDFVCHTQHNIFLTGKAGTGKTTFLQNLKNHNSKRLIIIAPTGVAAINAGGMTLHSFFQIPFGPFVPGLEEQHQNRKHRFNKEKINIIKTLDLLIIDEISMVRCDVLDAIDAVLRRYRRSQLPFGGVQLLMIGDLHQLPPVVKDDEWAILQAHYDSAYFFSSHALRKTEFHSIELQHIYRQSDAQFIELLNQVRENRLDEKSMLLLNSRYQADFKIENKSDYIMLTSHNRNADLINQQCLHELDAEPFIFNADIEGNFPEYNYPTAEKLILKKGAQVMFARNDTSQEKLYFNGKIGRISVINEHFIQVKCAADEHEKSPDTFHEIRIEKVSWENIKYTIDQQTKEISEEVVGQFSQYPLRLAWAITIHKSQGLTFEHAVIDANAAFSHGQVYVALSRCKTFEGMILSSPISHRAVKTDQTVSQFVDHASRNIPTAEQLNAAKIDYQKKLISDCFDFQTIRYNFNFLNNLLREYQNVVQISGFDSITHGSERNDIETIEVQLQEDVFKVSDKFKNQLHSIIEKSQVSETSLPEDDVYLQQRLSKASTYFTEKLQQKLSPWAFSISFETDNKELRKRIKKSIEFLQQSLVLKLACLESCRETFSCTAYLNALATAEIDFKSQNNRNKQTVDYSLLDIGQPELFELLKSWRSGQAKKEDVAAFQILHQKVIIQIAIILPDSPGALKKIKGVGKRTVEKYGEVVIAIVADYCQKNNIAPNQSLPASLAESSDSNEKEKQKKSQAIIDDTKHISYEMFKSGKTIAEIAQQRGFVNSTIENHLAWFIGRGELDILDLLSAEKLAVIKEKISELNTESLKEIKVALGDDYSYGEIRMVKEFIKKT